SCVFCLIQVIVSSHAASSLSDSGFWLTARAPRRRWPLIELDGWFFTIAVICELVNSHLACFIPGGLHPASCHGVQREQPLHVPGHGHQAPLASNAIETA